MEINETVPPSVAAIIEREPERVVDCAYCKRRHHPYMPCVADENTVCRVCGEKGHFECSC